MKELLFWVVMTAIVLNSATVVLSIVRPDMRVWPPPRKASWQYVYNGIMSFTGLLGIVGKANLVSGIGYGAPQRALYLAGVVQQSNGVTSDMGEALGHLDRGVVESHDAGAYLGNYGFRHDEGLAEETVKPLRDVPRQFDMLTLVLANRHLMCIVEQDVSRHEHRVVQ